MYINASTDAYPDNNLLAVRQSTWNNVYFILFIFLNFFILSVIPGSLVYYTFRETKIKITLEEEIKQQESLILAYATLINPTEAKGWLSNERFIEWLLFVYEQKKASIEHVTQVSV